MAQGGVERRLAAILVADVAGYSRLMGADESGALAALTTHRKEVVDPKIAEHGGRVVKLMGDGMLVEFPSVVEATRCAVEIQQAMARRNAGVSKDRRVVFRIGVNLGDIIVEGEDIHGDGVNVAARLEAFAAPGSLCVSGEVYRQIEGKIGLAFEDLGEQSMKNIAKPVRVWRWATEPLAPARSQEVSLALPDKPSIAVLPFSNMSGDPEQEYFSDGITEDIITGLSHFRSLFVIARNSTFTYKGRAANVQKVGEDLGVAYVIEGSVRKVGNRVRITVQLIDAQSGNHVWAQRYDRDLDDIFAVQDDVTEAIVASVSGRLEAADLERARRKTTVNMAAYDYLLRGKDYHHRFTGEDNAKALVALEKAIALDPGYAQAHAWLSCTLGQAWVREYLSGDSWERCVAEAEKAHSLDENDSECHRILSAIHLQNRDYEQAEHHHDRAFALNPNDPLIVSQKGYLLTMLGNPEEGVEWIRKAMRFDPYRPDLFANNLGIALHMARRYAEAVNALKRITALRYPHHAYLAACHAELGDLDEAQADVAEVVRLMADFSVARYAETLSYRERAQRDHFVAGMRKAGLPE